MKLIAPLLALGCLAGVIGCAAALAAPAAAPTASNQSSAQPPATQPAAAGSTSSTTQPALSDVHVNQEEVDKLQKYWDERVTPHRKALQEAAEAHYKVMADLRREQQRLIDEADRIQRTIDKLEKEYQDMTTPRPENGQ